MDVPGYVITRGVSSIEEQLLKEESLKPHIDNHRPWIHATYHSVISILGIIGLLALPLSFSYLGWVGGVILFIASTLVSFYSGKLLIECQDVTQHKTYSELADGNMGEGWSMKWIRPFQGLIFITILSSSVIASGQLLIMMDVERNGIQNLNDSSWYALGGLMLFIVSLAPNVDKSWTVSFAGTVATVVAVIMFLVGCGQAINEVDDVSYSRPEDDTTADYAMGVLSSFGILAFAYGGHSIVPDVHASLNHKDPDESKKQMTKAWGCSYLFVAPSYLLIVCLAYAAFGNTTSSSLVEDIAPYVSQNFLWALYTFALINIFAVGAIYNQAAFTYLEDMVMLFGPRFCRCTMTEEEHTDGLFVGEGGRKHWHKKLAIRFLFVGIGTFIGVALPFFGDLAALTGAIGSTPLTFVYPFVIYNNSEVGKKAPTWKRGVNYFLAFVFTVLGVCAVIGAIYNIVQNASTYKPFS